MRRTISSFLIIFICFILQCTLFHKLSFGGIIPNLLIVVTSSLGFMNGERTGIWVGFSCGILCDIFFGSVLGFYALIYMYIGYVNGKFAAVFYPQDIKLPISMIVLSDLSYGVICYAIMFLLRGRFAFDYYFVHIMLPEAVYTIIITLFLYPVILWIHNRLEKSEQRRGKKFV